MMSNVLQRDNVIFARKLDPLLETTARLNDQKVDMRNSERNWNNKTFPSKSFPAKVSSPTTDKVGVERLIKKPKPKVISTLYCKWFPVDMAKKFHESEMLSFKVFYWFTRCCCWCCRSDLIEPGFLPLLIFSQPTLTVLLYPAGQD